MASHRYSGHENIHMETVKVPVDDLQIGMFVSKLDRPWLGTPFLLQGFELKTRADIEAIQSVCKYVYVDKLTVKPLEPANTRRPKIGGGARIHSQFFPPIAPLNKEIDKAHLVQEKTSGLITNFISDIENGRSVDIQLARSAVAECVSSILRNSEAMMLLTQIRNKDEYTSQHSFNVCVYSVLLGRQIGLESPDLEDVGLCGLLHDMGKIQVPSDILNKDEGLTREEFTVMQAHTIYGREILLSGKNVFNGTVDAAYGHHENFDGSGYPRGVEARNTSLFTRIVAVVDKYDAITSDRIYRAGRTHMEAVDILRKIAGNKIDPELTMAFTSGLGLYPPGCVVELSSGEIAVVIEQNPVMRLRPRIIICRDCNKQPTPERYVDLAEKFYDEAGKPYAIRRQHRPRDFEIDLKKFEPLINRAIW